MLRKLPFLLIIIGCCTSVQSQQDVDTSFFLGGIQVGEADQIHWTECVKNAGMNTVEVTVYARQGNWDSDQLWFDETDEGALQQIEAAKQQGLKVVLILRVALDHAYERNKFIWHGMILPESRRTQRRWFRKYSAFALKWARIANDCGVDCFVIGSEMNALTATVQHTALPLHYNYLLSDSLQRERENKALKYIEELSEDLWVQGYKKYESLTAMIDDKIAANIRWAEQITFKDEEDALEKMNQRSKSLSKDWRKLIRRTREVFDGSITYAANFDSYQEVDFWDALDYVGINAYFPLRKPNGLSGQHLRSELLEGWHQVFDEIDIFRNTNQVRDKPLLFTELGYTCYSGTTYEPWSGFGFTVVGEGVNERLIIWNKQQQMLHERAEAIRALCDVVSERQCKLSGVLYWKLTSMESQLDMEPFAICIGKGVNDPALNELRNFNDYGR